MKCKIFGPNVSIWLCFWLTFVVYYFPTTFLGVALGIRRHVVDTYFYSIVIIYYYYIILKTSLQAKIIIVRQHWASVESRHIIPYCQPCLSPDDSAPDVGPNNTASFSPHWSTVSEACWYRVIKSLFWCHFMLFIIYFPTKIDILWIDQYRPRVQDSKTSCRNLPQKFTTCTLHFLGTCEIVCCFWHADTAVTLPPCVSKTLT